MNCEMHVHQKVKATHEIQQGGEVLAICCECHEQCQTENWHEKDKEMTEMLND